MKAIAKISFIIGLLSAAVIGLMPGLGGTEKFLGLSTVTLVIIAAGFFVGLVNLKGTETNAFLITTIALLVTGNAGLIVVNGVGSFLSGIMLNIIAFVAPAAVLVAGKVVYEIAAK